DAAALAQVADEIGVNGALVAPAALRVGGPDRQVHGAADLLVQQHVASAPVDAVVRADPELAEPAGALVGVEEPDEILLAALRRSVDDLPGLEAKAHARDLPAAHHRGQVEAHLALDRILDRAGEELAVGH